VSFLPVRPFYRGIFYQGVPSISILTMMIIRAVVTPHESMRPHIVMTVYVLRGEGVGVC
jgi:hypothetical protein